VNGVAIQSSLLRLFIVAHQKCVISDILFNGLLKTGKEMIKVEHQILEDGLLISVPTENKYASEGRVELFCNGKLLGREPLTFFTMLQYYSFIPSREQYRCIDFIGVAMSADTMRIAKRGDSVKIYAVGFDREEHIQVGQHLTMHVGQDNFYEPRYLEVRERPLPNRFRIGLNSPFYEILPEAFVCRQPFRLSLDLPYTNKRNDLSGLCWLDKKKDRWVWLDDSEYLNDTVTATSLGGGGFAAVLDGEPPTFKLLTLADGRTYNNFKPAVNFVIDEELSGIGSDEDIVIEIDGNWLIPEYDPETGQIFSKPLEMLSEGQHHLGIRVRDRAGNLGEHYLKFRVHK
jgi:hypothetical protein